MEPEVSVLMAVRNGAKHLPETLGSLSEQSLREIEFVVVDDCSDDATPRILADWAARNPRVNLLTAETPIGLARALNWGLDACRASLVARADADDLYHPKRLARQVAAFRNDPDLGVLSSSYLRVDEAGAVINRVDAARGHDWIRFRMLFMNSMLHPGVMFRAEAVRAAGCYDPSYWTAQDSDLWARMVEIARFDNLPDVLVHYRVHDRSVMRSRGDAGRLLSLTVPARLQKAYVGRDDYDIAATVDLFQGYRTLDRDEIRRGLKGLARIHAVARKRESAAVLARFRASVARSLSRQARRLHRRGAPGMAETMAHAVLWRLRAGRGADPR